MRLEIPTPQEVVDVHYLGSTNLIEQFDNHYRTVMARAKSETLRARTEALWPDQALKSPSALEVNDIMGLKMFALVIRKGADWMYTMSVRLQPDIMAKDYFVGVETALRLSALWHMPSPLSAVFQRDSKGMRLTAVVAPLYPETVEEFKLNE